MCIDARLSEGVRERERENGEQERSGRHAPGCPGECVEQGAAAGVALAEQGAAGGLHHQARQRQPVRMGGGHLRTAGHPLPGRLLQVERQVSRRLSVLAAQRALSHAHVASEHLRERRRLHLHTPSARRRSDQQRAALRKVESRTKRQVSHNTTLSLPQRKQQNN